MEAPLENQCTRRNGTKIPRPSRRTQQHPKKNVRPMLATMDRNCKIPTKQDLKQVEITSELKGMSKICIKDRKAKEVLQKSKPPHLQQSCADPSTRGTTTTTRGIRSDKASVRVKELRPPKLLVKDSSCTKLDSEVEFTSLEPDCQPDLNSLSRLHMAKDSPDFKDSDDPQQCTIYIHEIYHNLLCAERDAIFTLRKDLLSQQEDMDASHRRVLVNWMVQVHSKFNLLPDTLHISVDILDRYLQKVPATKKNLQLVGITAMFIASKYEEIYPPSITEFSYITADTYTTAQVRKMEIDILRTLDYHLGKPNTLTFLRRYSKLMAITTQVHNLAKYLIEACYLSVDCRNLLPSQLAVGALLLAASIIQHNKKEGKELWGATMQKFTWYSKQRASTFMREVARQMKSYFQLLCISKSSNCMAVKEKYSEGYHYVAALPRLQAIMETLSSPSRFAPGNNLLHSLPLLIKTMAVDC